MLPETGYLRLKQIIGQREITSEEADRNKSTAVKSKTHKPKRPRIGVTPIIPVSKSQWYQGIKDGKYPAPIHLGPRTSVWRVEDIRTLLKQLSEI